MKHIFEEKMRESNNLFREEQRATDIARRLQENNEYVQFSTVILHREADFDFVLVNYWTCCSTSMILAGYLLLCI